MRYLIDGYNLLHATGHLMGRVGPHELERARLALLVHLHQCLGADAGEATVVFDARRAPPGTAPQQEYKGVRVLNALRQEADDLIEELIRTHPAPHKLTVVSEDRRLRDAAGRRRCRVQACVDFFDAIATPAPPAPADSGENAKPQSVSDREVADLLRVFGELPDEGPLGGKPL